jgi:hypothetical protein
MKYRIFETEAEAIAAAALPKLGVGKWAMDSTRTISNRWWYVSVG